MLKVGDKVRFKYDIWNFKRKIALAGGLFGPPLKEDAKNEFEIIAKNNNGPDSELLLSGYPWLVYEDELEKIENSEK